MDSKNFWPVRNEMFQLVDHELLCYINLISEQTWLKRLKSDASEQKPQIKSAIFPKFEKRHHDVIFYWINFQVKMCLPRQFFKLSDLR